MLATCENCHRTVTPLKQGFPELFTSQKFKCPNCHKPVKPKEYNWAIYIAVFSFIATILLMALSTAYSSTVTVSNTQIGQIRGDFYGVSTPVAFSQYQNVSDGMTNNKNVTSNYTWEQQMFIDMKGSTIRRDMYLNYYANSDGTFTSSAVKTQQDYITFCHVNNCKIRLILDYMPVWLQNRTSGFCTSASWESCPANFSNYTAFAQVGVNYIKNVTNNSQYLSDIEVEVWNEAYGGSFMNALSKDNITKAYEYVKLYNASYDLLKANFPTLKVYGGNGYYVDSPNMINTFLSNLTNKWDGVTYHQYISGNSEYNKHIQSVQNATEWMLSRCAFYNANCSSLLLTEWNLIFDLGQVFTSKHGMHVAGTMSYFLNNLPSSISMNMFKFDTDYKNHSIDVNYNYSMISQFEPEVYIPYNITKLFATNHKALNTVYNSTSTNESLKVVVSKDTSKTYITLTNTLSEAVNVTLNVNLQNSYLRNVETNTTYPIINGQAQILNLAGYGVLTMDSNSIVATVDFNSLIGVVRNDFYGVNVPISFSSNSNVSTDLTCTRPVYLNYTKLKEDFLASGMKTMRRDMNIQDYVNPDMTIKSIITPEQELTKFAYDNNLTIIYIADYMPSWLADNVTGKYGHCSNLAFCPASNYTNATGWNNAVLSFIRNVTNNGEYNRSLKIEVWNEPYGIFFLNNQSNDDPMKALAYIELYNYTYDAVKSVYSDMDVIGLGGVDETDRNLIKAFFTNFSNKFDGYSVHKYYSSASTSDAYTTTINNLTATCLSYGGTKCSNIYFDEWNTDQLSIYETINQSAYTSNIYTQFLNINPTNLTSALFRWSSGYLNASCDSAWKYGMYLSANNTKLRNYDITKLFTHYAPAQSNIYNVTISLGTVKAVVSKKSNACNVIFTNTNTTDVEVGLNASTAQCGNIWMKVSDGTLYNASSGLASLGNLSGYGVEAFTTPNLTLSSSGLNKTNYLGEQIGSLGSEIYYSSTTRDEIHIASTLPTYNVTVIADANCELVSKAVYTSKSRSFSKTYEGSSLICTHGKLYLGEVVVDPSNESNTIRLYPSAEIQAICEESEQQMQDAVKIVGMLLSILLLGSVIGIIVAYVQGYIDLDVNIKNIRFEQVVGGILIISFTFLLIVTIVYITSSYCPALT